MPEKGSFKFRETKARPFIGAVKHEHGPDCNHEHSCDHDHSDHDHGPASPPASWLRRTFNRISALSDEYGKKPGFLALTGALLGTTALVNPALALLLMPASYWFLLKTGDMIVDHATALGNKMDIPDHIRGVFIGAMFAAAEIAIGVTSATHNTPDIGIGTLVGSNIAHTLLVLGAVAAITPIAKGRGSIWKFNTLAMAGTTGVLAAQLMTNNMTWPAAIGLSGLTIAYGYGLAKTMQKDAAEQHVPVTDLIHHHGHGSSCSHHHSHDNSAEKASRLKNLLYVAGGVAGSLIASNGLVDGVVHLAASTDFNQAAISSIAISLGAVAPELSASWSAAKRNNTDMAIGNVLSCNIFNVLLASTAMSVVGVDVPPELSPSSPMGLFNLAALGTSAALLTKTLLAQKGAVKRWQGYVALGLYAAYLAGSGWLGKTAAPEDVDRIPQPAAISAPASPRISAQIPPQLYAPRQA
jgi:cation:H+ antiporter